MWPYEHHAANFGKNVKCIEIAITHKKTGVKDETTDDGDARGWIMKHRKTMDNCTWSKLMEKQKEKLPESQMRKRCIHDLPSRTSESATIYAKPIHQTFLEFDRRAQSAGILKHNYRSRTNYTLRDCHKTVHHWTSSGTSILRNAWPRRHPQVSINLSLTNVEIIPWRWFYVPKTNDRWRQSHYSSRIKKIVTTEIKVTKNNSELMQPSNNFEMYSSHNNEQITINPY